MTKKTSDVNKGKICPCNSVNSINDEHVLYGGNYLDNLSIII